MVSYLSARNHKLYLLLIATLAICAEELFVCCPCMYRGLHQVLEVFFFFLCKHARNHK